MPTRVVFKEPSPSEGTLVLKDREGKRINVSMRRTLDGNLMFTGHHCMSIVVMPEKSKIIAFPKGEFTDDVYANQDELFNFLTHAGVITPDTVIGGNIYGSIEAKYTSEKKSDEDPMEVVILNVHNFLTKDKQDHAIRKKYIDDLEKELLSADDEETTELGEVPQERTKGSIPKWGFPSRGIYRYNY